MFFVRLRNLQQTLKQPLFLLFDTHFSSNTVSTRHFKVVHAGRRFSSKTNDFRMSLKCSEYFASCLFVLQTETDFLLLFKDNNEKPTGNQEYRGHS